MPATTNLGDVLRVLTNDRRRAVVASLRESNPRKVENIIPGDDAVRVEMHHRHFPALEDAGVIAWNADDDVIARGPDWERYETVLDRIEAGEHGGDVARAHTAVGD